MGQATINFLNTETTVPRDSSFNLQFEIIKPVPEVEITEKVQMVSKGELEEGNLYDLDVNLSNWVSINSLSSEEDENTNQYILITGLKKISYRYKVEIVENSNIVKSFTDYIIDQDTTDNSVILSEDMFKTWTPYTIKVTVEQDNGEIVENTLQIHIYDTEPILRVAEVENNILSFQLGDLESDDIKYRIKLNGSQLYPPNTTVMTSLQPTPISGNLLLPKDKIIAKKENQIIIEAQDSLGASTSFTPISFIGQYQGLMFIDENNEEYTTDLGVINKLIEFDLIQAGQTSIIKTIYLKNLTGYDIKDLKITLDTSVSINSTTGTNIENSSIPEKTAMWIAKDESSFIEGTNEIIYNDVIMSGEKVPFVLKITTDIFSSGVGQFGLYAIATPS